MTAPITIRTIQDINDSADRIEALAVRCAQAIAQELEDWGDDDNDPAADCWPMPRHQVLTLLQHCMAAAMVDQPAIGEAVDIAGNRFASAMAAELAAQGVA